MSRNLPKYDVPSWELLPDDHDATNDDLLVVRERAIANLCWFLSHPMADEFSTDEVAEFFEIRPESVAAIAEECKTCEPMTADGCYSRDTVIALGTSTCLAWHLGDVLETAARMMIPNPRPDRSTIPESRLNAIRAFFTDPKGRYTIREIEMIFGDDMPDVRATFDMRGDRDSEDRPDVADFLRGDVPAVIVGRALEGLETPLSLETHAIELPAWMWRALEVDAKEGGYSVSETLSMELHSYLNYGLSETYASAAEPLQPKYDRIVITAAQPTPAGVSPRTRKKKDHSRRSPSAQARGCSARSGTR